jgi:hypothetical protein
LYNLFLPLARNDLTKFNVTIGYEDRALDDVERLDYDYNDWAVSIVTKFEGDYVDEDTIELEKITFKMIPKSRGGKIGHKFYLRIDANTFNSDGEYELVIKGKPDKPGDSLPENVGDKFKKSEEIDVPVNFLDIGCDCEAFGKHEDNGQEKKWNVYEDRPDLIREAQRWAELSIEFKPPFVEFDLPDYEAHCQGLFFDPYLKVKYDVKPEEQEISWKPEGYEPELCDPGNPDKYDPEKCTEYRILCVEDPGWQWPEEAVRIDDAYSVVTFTKAEPPRPEFPPGWHLTPTHCVFGDGIPCTKK